jgi:hypothetical protein
MPNDEQIEIQRLINLVLSSGRLPKSRQEPERKLLSFLGGGAASAAQMAGAHAKNEGLIRVELGRLRKHLDKFFAEQPEGRRCVQRLVIAQELVEGGRTPNPYALRLGRNRFPVEQFWSPHAVGETSLVWTEPLVFYDRKNRAYVRYLDLNSDSSDPVEVSKLFAGRPHPAKSMIPCFGYQSSGDIVSVYQLERSLNMLGIATTRVLTRDSVERDVVGKNTVIVGNARMNTYVAEFQKGSELMVGPKSVTLATPGKKEPAEYVDYEPAEQGGRRQCAYGVLTRRPNFNHGKTVTMIAANHGRAIEKIAEYITADGDLEQLWEMMGQQRSSWPSRFQALFEVEVTRERQVVDYQKAKPLLFREWSASSG